MFRCSIGAEVLFFFSPPPPPPRASSSTCCFSFCSTTGCWGPGESLCSTARYWSRGKKKKKNFFVLFNSEILLLGGFLFDSEIQEDWHWAPMSREVGDTWRWWNGSLVDLSGNDTEMLRTQPTSSQPSCAVWRLNHTLRPASCELRHAFMCLRETCEFMG